MDEGDQKVQPSSCKTNTGDVLYNVVTIIYNIVYLKYAKGIDLKISHWKKNVTFWSDGCYLNLL